jgi:hypothetical protein
MKLNAATYSVTIERTASRWEARDNRGRLRCQCDLHFAATAAQSVAMMFHAAEVASVTIVDPNSCRASIRVY